MDEFKILRRKAMTSAKSTLRLIQRESLSEELTDVVGVCKDCLEFLDKEGGSLPNSQTTRQTMTLMYDAFGRINEPLRKRASTSWIRSKPKKLDKRAIYQQKNSIDGHLQKLRRLARRRATSPRPASASPERMRMEPVAVGVGSNGANSHHAPPVSASLSSTPSHTPSSTRRLVPPSKSDQLASMHHRGGSGSENDDFEMRTHSEPRHNHRASSQSYSQADFRRVFPRGRPMTGPATPNEDEEKPRRYRHFADEARTASPETLSAPLENGSRLNSATPPLSDGEYPARSLSPLEPKALPFEVEEASPRGRASSTEKQITTPREPVVEQTALNLLDSSTHQIQQDVLMYRNLFYRRSHERGLTREEFSEKNQPLEENELLEVHNVAWRELQHLRISPPTLDAQLLSRLGFDAHNETYQGYGIFHEVSSWNSQVSRGYNEGVLERLYDEKVGHIMDEPQNHTPMQIRTAWGQVKTGYSKRARGPWKARVLTRFTRSTWRRDLANFSLIHSLFQSVAQLQSQITDIRLADMDAQRLFAEEMNSHPVAAGIRAPTTTPAVGLGNGVAPTITLPQLPTKSMETALTKAFDEMSASPTTSAASFQEDPITPLSPPTRDRDPTALYLDHLEEREPIEESASRDSNRVEETDTKSGSEEESNPWDIVEQGLPRVVKEHVDTCDALQAFLRKKFAVLNKPKALEGERDIENELDDLSQEYDAIDERVHKDMEELRGLRKSIAAQFSDETVRSAQSRERVIEKLNSKFQHGRRKLMSNLRSRLDTLVVVKPVTPRELMASPPSTPRENELLESFGSEIQRLTNMLNDNWVRLDEIENSDLSNVDNVYSLKSKLKVIQKLLDAVEDGMTRVKKNLEKIRVNPNVEAPVIRVISEQVTALQDRFESVDDRYREAGGAVDKSLMSLKSDEGLSDDEEEHFCEGEVVYDNEWRILVIFFKKHEMCIYQTQDDFDKRRKAMHVFPFRANTFVNLRESTVVMGDGLHTVEFQTYCFSATGTTFHVRSRDDMRMWRSYIQTGINIRREKERWERRHSVSEEDRPRLMTSRRVRSHSAADLLDMASRQQSNKISLADLHRYAGYR